MITELLNFLNNLIIKHIQILTVLDPCYSCLTLIGAQCRWMTPRYRLLNECQMVFRAG